MAKVSLIAATALALYRTAAFLAGPLIARHINKRRSLGKEHPERFAERLGQPGAARPDGPLIWLHASSVGESLSALPLIERLRGTWPQFRILVTTGTVTSAKLMAERLPAGALHQFVPVDRLSAVRRFFDHWQPQMGLIVESEFWPNLLIEAQDRGIPLHLLNGRISRESFRSWKRARPVIRRLLDCFTSIQAQSPEDQTHFAALGRSDSLMPGNLKFAAPPLEANPQALARLEGILANRARWLIYSTHPGEEAIAAETHRLLAGPYPGILTLIVPRHPERGPALAAELRDRGFQVALRSRNEAITDSTDVYLADTIGELGLWFRLCEVVMVGGTLVPKGGQNPIEAARLDCALICGPHTENFVRIVADMIQGGALFRIETGPQAAEQLSAAVAALLEDEKRRRQMIGAARHYAEAQGEVLERVLTLLEPDLNRLTDGYTKVQ